MHRITVLSENPRFSLAADRQAEIYDVWPFHLHEPAMTLSP